MSLPQTTYSMYSSILHDGSSWWVAAGPHLTWLSRLLEHIDRLYCGYSREWQPDPEDRRRENSPKDDAALSLCSVNG